MVALVIGQMPLQRVEALVDVVGQSDVAGREVDGADAAGCESPDLLGDLVVDVGGGHHRLGSFDTGLVLDSAEDATLASAALPMDTGVHSKTSWGRTSEC